VKMKSALVLATSLTMLAMPAVAADAARPAVGLWGFDEAGMDKSVKPGDDFVAYANGKYLKALEIPADRSSYGVSSKLRELSQERTRQIIEDAARQPAAPGSNAQKVGDY
jgi:putative endopeptidase